MATYNYGGKTYTQAQLDEIAKNATPAQREALNKQFGTAYARAEPVFTGDANHPDSVAAWKPQSASVLTNVSAKVVPATTSFSNPSSTNNPNSTQAPPVGKVGTTTATTSTNNGEKTYTYNGKTYTQVQLDDIAKRATPAQREELNRLYGTAYARAEPVFSGDANNKQTPGNTGVVGPNQGGSPVPPRGGSPVVTPPVDNTPVQTGPSQDQIDAQNTFESGYAKYMKAQEDIYGMETKRKLEDYANRSADAKTAIERNRADYERFTGQEVQDTARQLALNNTEFARSLTNASRAYGQRGILGAGIQKASLGEGVGQFGENQGYFKTLSQRRLDTAGTTMNRAETDYTTGASRLETQRGQYVGDRAAGLQVLDTQLQQQGDTLYNQSQVQNVQLKQQIADQAAIDKLYGRTPQNRPIGMRIGGKYTY